MAQCKRCGATVRGPADYCECGAPAPAANSLLYGIVVSLVIAAVALTMVYIGTDPTYRGPHATPAAPPANDPSGARSPQPGS